MATTKATTLAHGQAGSIVSGTLADARIPNLATSKITSGTFADARIAQSNVTQHEGSIDALGTLTGLTIADGGNIGSASDTDAISISSGGLVVDSARPYFWYIGTGNDLSISNGSRVPFGTLVDQRGNDYNASNYWFLTPIAGIYTISAQLYLYSSTGSTQAWRMVTEDSSGGGTETLLGRTRHPNSDIGQILLITFTGYIAANKAVSVKNDTGSNVKLYLNATSHTSFFGALVG